MGALIVQSYSFRPDTVQLVLGINDANLAYLEMLMATDLSVRGTTVTASDDVPLFTPFMQRLEKAADERGTLKEAEIFMEFQLLSEPSAVVPEREKGNPVIVAAGKQIYPKSRAEQELFHVLPLSDVVFSIGPAGTGKTFVSVIWALSEVLSGRKGKLLLTRPVVEAGESLGFLPGDLKQKLGPYLNPLYDAAEYVLSPQQIKRMEENGTIEIAPLAYMRGRSVNNAVMILDEAQNATRAQIKMFLTRLGENSQAIVTGDPSQTDLPLRKESGLDEAIEILSGIKGISVVRFTHSDTIRSRIVREIVRAYSEKEEKSEGQTGI